MIFTVSKTSKHVIYNLINGLVAPRPIALVTSLSPNGVLNAAPFSSYNYLCLDPPILGFGVAAVPDESRPLKDTARNIEHHREYVVNVVTEDIGRQMNICGIDFPAEVSEVEMAGFTTEESMIVKTPRIKEAHAAMECELFEIIKPGPGPARIILGKVVAIHVDDQFIDPQGPYILAKELHSIGRMNALNYYVRTRDAFIEIPRLNYEQWIKGDRG